jgi:hypothetical protein
VFFGQILRPLPDLPATTFANDQAKRLQDTPELIVDPNAHIDQLVPDDQQRLAFMRGHTLDPHGFEPADANHFG